MNWVSKVMLNTVWLPVISLTASVSAQVSDAIAERDGAVIATLHAEGAQVYECKLDPDESQSGARTLTWQFREPIAALFVDGKSIGRHYAGPNWDHIDASSVRGKMIASMPGAKPGDIPWLKLDVTARRGSGTLAGVSTVQRINTQGGVHAGACEKAGAFHSAPYAADYVFLRKGP
jgi:hypothetical protein